MWPNGTVFKKSQLPKKKKTDLRSVPREPTSSRARWWWSGGGDTGSSECGGEEVGGDGLAEDNSKWGKRRPYLGRQSSGVPDLKGRQEHSQHSRGSWGVKCVCVCVSIYVFCKTGVSQCHAGEGSSLLRKSVCACVCTTPKLFQMSKCLCGPTVFLCNLEARAISDDCTWDVELTRCQQPTLHTHTDRRTFTLSTLSRFPKQTT